MPYTQPSREAARKVVISWLSEAKPATEGTALDAVYRDVLARLVGPIATAFDAFAAQHFMDYLPAGNITVALHQVVDERDAALARAEAAEAIYEIASLDLEATSKYAYSQEERVRVLESALQGLGTHIADVGQCFKPDDCRVWHWKHVPACEDARKALEPITKAAAEEERG